LIFCIAHAKRFFEIVIQPSLMVSIANVGFYRNLMKAKEGYFY